MLKTASISLALLLALLVGNSAELRIIDAAGAYATPLRSAALRYAAAGSGSVHIEKTNASEALRRLDDGTAELILIAEDQLPETFTGCVWNYCTEPLILYVNADNPLREISSDDVARLLTDEHPAWSRYTGLRADIHRMARRGGAAEAAMGRLLGDRNPDHSIREIHSDESGLILLENDPDALLFGSWLDAIPLKAVALTIDHVPPLRKTVADGSYPLSVRRIFAAATPSADVENFLRLLDTMDNRRELSDSGRFPLDMQKQLIRNSKNDEGSDQ